MVSQRGAETNRPGRKSRAPSTDNPACLRSQRDLVSRRLRVKVTLDLGGMGSKREERGGK